MWVDILISILAMFAGILGIIGCIIPVVPGPPVAWIGMLLLYIWGNGALFGLGPVSTFSLTFWGIVVVIVTIFDYLVPVLFTKVTGGTKAGGWGAFVGLLFGVVLSILWSPIALVICAFLGAFLAELIFGDISVKDSFLSAVGSVLGFVVGATVKLIICVCIMFLIILNL